MGACILSSECGECGERVEPAAWLDGQAGGSKDSIELLESDLRTQGDVAGDIAGLPAIRVA
jgi:hypothetical protein